ncbi:MAG: hypothetical protein IKI97_02085 [Clostridia bacterium]|nr:hypothetical protein [Clostridia bacterium]
MNSFILKGNICYSISKTKIKTLSGYVVCKDGKCVGVFEEFPEEYKALELRDLKDWLIIPGMVDLHIHAPQYAFRGIGMDYELIEWLNAQTFPENFSGKFWAENDGDDYELHVELKADDMNIDLRDELISVSKSGKNAAAKGVMGKIRAVAETMLLAAFDSTLPPPLPEGEFYDSYGFNMGFGYIDPVIACETGYVYSWSLFNYKTAVEEKEEDAYAELERSIVAKLADDIIVGVRGKNVEIVVKKSFGFLYDSDIEK